MSAAESIDPAMEFRVYDAPGEMTSLETKVWAARYAASFEPRVMWDDADPLPWAGIAEDAVNDANAAVNALRLVRK